MTEHNSISSQKIRVLVVDDSAVIRTLISKSLARDPEIEVVGTAADPYIARDKLLELKPDVMTLDIEMPRMDGLTFLAKVMDFFPTRTIVISSLSENGSAVAFRALQVGAIDVMPKPVFANEKDVLQFANELVEKVKICASARIIKKKPTSPDPKTKSSKPVFNSASDAYGQQIIAVASSTGGTEALKRVLPFLPADIPGMVIVQHMPALFTKTFSASLQERCPFEVREAKNGDRIHSGLALIAPGDFHMEIVRMGGLYSIRLHQEPLLNGVRPAADYLFNSVAKSVGAYAIGLVLTGMGKDGAAGLLAMKQAGSFNICQDEATSVIFGMPKEAIRCGAVNSVLPIDEIAAALMKAYEKKSLPA